MPLTIGPALSYVYVVVPLTLISNLSQRQPTPSIADFLPVLNTSAPWTSCTFRYAVESLLMCIYQIEVLFYAGFFLGNRNNWILPVHHKRQLPSSSNAPRTRYVPQTDTYPAMHGPSRQAHTTCSCLPAAAETLLHNKVQRSVKLLTYFTATSHSDATDFALDVTSTPHPPWRAQATSHSLRWPNWSRLQA